jgi:hypothetical protein
MGLMAWGADFKADGIGRWQLEVVSWRLEAKNL